MDVDYVGKQQLKFQSTLPRGERPLQAIRAQRHNNFNPRSREGSDCKVHRYCKAYEISIHAPARGATFSQITQCGRNLISIHAPARGATVSRSMGDSFSFISIHAPARGATQTICSLRLMIEFQSTLPRGERLAPGAVFDLNEGISIHAPARGATAILSKIHPMFLTISHNASSFSSFPFHSFLPHLLNSSTFCALFQVRISRGFSVYYRFAPKKSTPDLQLYHVLHRYVQL